MADDTPWTLGRLLKWTTDFLKERGADSPRLDAEVLLAHVCGCQRIELYTRYDEVADEPTRSQFRELVRRRAAGEPVAYLVGHREFYSRDFRVTPDVLIPRPETEFVLIALLDLVKRAGQQNAPIRIADVGTGSGVLAVCAALNLPQAQILATDISAAALEVARDNAAKHAVGQRIRWIESDLFAQVPADEQFDYVMANPPYIGLDERATLPRDVVDHEPHTALFAGPGGLDVLTRLIQSASQRLLPGGWLLCEFNPDQQADLIAQIERIAELDPPRFIEDLSKRPRVICIPRQVDRESPGDSTHAPKGVDA
jgi:release factor glutamine methyltransferase